MSRSPLVKQVSGTDLNFYEALQEIMTGKSVTKKEWKDKKIFGILVDGRLKIHLADDTYHDWLLSDGDIYGEDYVVL